MSLHFAECSRLIGFGESPLTSRAWPVLGTCLLLIHQTRGGKIKHTRLSVLTSKFQRERVKGPENGFMQSSSREKLAEVSGGGDGEGGFPPVKPVISSQLCL